MFTRVGNHLVWLRRALLSRRVRQAACALILAFLGTVTTADDSGSLPRTLQKVRFSNPLQPPPTAAIPNATQSASELGDEAPWQLGISGAGGTHFLEDASLGTNHPALDLAPIRKLAPLAPPAGRGAGGEGFSDRFLTTIDSLDGRDIACCTAARWLPADILRSRARTLVQLFCDEDEESRRAARGLSHFLHLQGKHQQDIGAASALRAYYTRISLAEQLTLSEVSRDFIDSEASKQSALQNRGLPAGTDVSSFERKRIEVEDQQLQLLSQDRQLRCLIAQLAGMDYAMYSVHVESLSVIECSLDCQRLTQVALAHRQDLRGWSYLACQINEDSAPIFAKMLTTVVGGWGLPIPTISGLKQLLCPPDYSCLAANMRHEVQLTVDTHRRWICQAVQEKCAKLELAYQRIRLAQQTIESWEARLAQLERLDEMGDRRPAEKAEARGELLKARSEEIRRRLDAKLAEVDLAEATGGISDRCCAGMPWLLTGYE